MLQHIGEKQHEKKQSHYAHRRGCCCGIAWGSRDVWCKHHVGYAQDTATLTSRFIRPTHKHATRELRIWLIVTGESIVLEPEAIPGCESPPSTPHWVKAIGILCILLVVMAGVRLLQGEPD